MTRRVHKESVFMYIHQDARCANSHHIAGNVTVLRQQNVPWISAINYFAPSTILLLEFHMIIATEVSLTNV